MRTVYKTPIHLHQAATGLGTVVEVHNGAKPVHVDYRNGVPCVWWEVEDSNPLAPRLLFVLSTGSKIPDQAPLRIGTVQDNGYVWHFYTSVV